MVENQKCIRGLSAGEQDSSSHDVISAKSPTEEGSILSLGQIYSSIYTYIVTKVSAIRESEYMCLNYVWFYYAYVRFSSFNIP